jgi:hypothetical protein
VFGLKFITPSREQTQKLFDSIHALSKKGIKNAQIARELRIHRHTVEKYLPFETPPQRRHFTKKVSAIAPYEDYILGAGNRAAATPPRSTRRSPSKATPAPTRTSGASPATSRNRSV